jgi:hypothetical protein
LANGADQRGFGLSRIVIKNDPVPRRRLPSASSALTGS